MIERHTLDNGLRIVAQKIPGSFATSILVMIKTGSRNETPEIHGISHFLEHMNFKGTEKRPTYQDIAKEVDSMGAENNAFTGKEYTAFYLKSDKKHFEKSLDILSDITFCSTLPEEELEKEKGTIIEEINMYEDTPMYLAPDLFEQILFENIQLSQNILGEKQTVKGISAEVMREYRDKYYNPGNAIISCVGSLPDKYTELIGKYFGQLSGKKEDYIVSKRDNQAYQRSINIKNKKTEQSHIVFGVEAYDINSQKKYALKILSIILGGNSSSRLHEEIREKRGLAYYVHSFTEENFDSGVFGVRAGLNTEKTEEAIKIIRDELLNSKNNIKEDDILRAKEYIRGAAALAEEDSMSIANRLATEDILGGKALPIEERLKLYEKVSLDDVKSVAKEIFKPEKIKLAVIGPYENEDKFVKILKS
jgi:predicted Zn-dependent peptidase